MFGYELLAIVHKHYKPTDVTGVHSVNFLIILFQLICCSQNPYTCYSLQICGNVNYWLN